MLRELQCICHWRDDRSSGLRSDLAGGEEMTFDVSITIPVWLLVLAVWAVAGFALPSALNWNVGVMFDRRQYKRWLAAIFVCGPFAWLIVGWDRLDEFNARRRRRKRAAARKDNT